eukprot:GHUV01048165.1.p1 GENE.GHUV01048165.1~~GHUV01048165.1.p1  ORF type:complete len:139 (+),score=18.04 GHUV01048165.1:44-460(+)
MWQATVMGFGIGVIGEFLFLFLQDLGGSESLMGLTLTVTCIAEVPAFHYQPQLLKMVSVHTMLHIVMWAYVVRLGLYALLPYVGSAWAVLPAELLVSGWLAFVLLLHACMFMFVPVLISSFLLMSVPVRVHVLMLVPI